MSQFRPPCISVLMPAYNAERYVEQAVRSVLGQTFTDFEFLIINDGSTDQTGAILERLAEEDERIRLVSRPNTGYVAALNEMIGMARASLLARMDADDVALPERFERQVAYLQAHPDCLVVGSAVQVVDSDGDPLCVWNIDVSNHEQIDLHHLNGRRGAVLCHPSVLMRADAVRAVGGYRPELEPAEDMDLYLRLAERGRLANLTEPLLHYRMVPTSASHARKREQVIGLRKAISEAYQRRKLPPGPLPPLPDHPAKADLTKLSYNRHLWGWWALGTGNVRTARKHAWAALVRSPWSSRSWRLMLCAIRGR
ncbi:glycosyltransferase family 2 protein [Tautonia rosea]|uniref:glycosyltransferase family 2 protein n=1 Tax=Tautonia rosea TaxID=2728037 RepID=UPI001473A3A4|nr:glycosyltransferase [Tautonia rosea]